MSSVQFHNSNDILMIYNGSLLNIGLGVTCTIGIGVTKNWLTNQSD